MATIEATSAAAFEHDLDGFGRVTLYAGKHLGEIFEGR
jgi:hypothetical protein